MLGRVVFLIQECWLNFRRQGLMALTCISTSAIALTILGVFVLLAWHVHAIATAIPRQFEVHAFVRADLPRSETEALAVAVRRMDGVARVSLVPKEHAWDEYRKHYAAPEDLEGMENPLPDKLEIAAVTPEKTLEVARKVRELPNVDAVRGGEEVLQRLLAIANGVRITGVFLALLLALGTIAIISNAIKITLFARRRDIRVMQLVGATNGFIRTPFVLEGMLEGGIGGAVACGGMALVMHYFTNHVLPGMTLVRELQLNLDIRLFCAFLILAGLLFGVLGSLLSLRRFLRAA
jgi:cell division transport system permease protein